MHTVLGLLLLGVVLVPTGEVPATYGGAPAASVAASAAGPGGRHVLHVAGERRTYELHRPAGAGAHPPLVVALHGLGGSGAGFRAYSGWDDVAARTGALVAYPDSFTEGWRSQPDADQDVRFLTALVRRLVARAGVDRDRVYVTGHSSGGFMSFRMACDRSGLVAGIGPVAGAQVPDCAREPGPVRVAAVHGTADEVVPYAGYGGLPSARESARRWVRHDRCAPRPQMRRSGRLQVATWSRCDGRSAVRLTTVRGGDHGYPAAASRWIWRFLD
jgi:polyhydroxybutyrate depolymerase